MQHCGKLQASSCPMPPSARARCCRQAGASYAQNEQRRNAKRDLCHDAISYTAPAKRS